MSLYEGAPEGGDSLTNPDGVAAAPAHETAAAAPETAGLSARVLFALARGAWVVTPAWACASLERGAWAPVAAM